MTQLLASSQTLTLNPPFGLWRTSRRHHRSPAEAEWRWRAEEDFRQNCLGFAEPVGHARSVKKGVQLVNDWFEAERDFQAFSGSPRTRTGLGRLRDPKPLLKLGPHIGKISFNCRIKGNRIHGVPPFGHHTCLLCTGSRVECEQSYGSFGMSWIIF